MTKTTNTDVAPSLCTCDLVYDAPTPFLGDPEFAPYEPTSAEVTRLQPFADRYARARRALGYGVTLREAQVNAALVLNDVELYARLMGRRSTTTI